MQKRKKERKKEKLSLDLQPVHSYNNSVVLVVTPKTVQYQVSVQDMSAR